ncbi:CDP-diacylglycerol--glycerol-3-phosphate 3-phosphatidyltransferase [Candidatus Cytomitobacter indipagum]|uniref:CDP-diacylglycerol--glycerol-3-phosphate 3-phosphatidyltransferase n=1 Tax=Candidatus Cytomitobacter indipagum TaxID=2601575 RepID=A0A5C0UE08_9PROT|nr:CDP-diacylglycerol--glycerol-3-phosphate 3-phosphatidyltransferase [Candidatus Cytomitobacter indipagum]QEK37940.1 CDP-diacylglycerol--glycerol-3-phosphate 3-phosphatidyltransferase [Candidatus Cytomitobacter indipagum]
MLLLLLPNIITMFRIIATPAICILISYEVYFYSCILFASACLSDFLDGYIARAYKMTSKFGQHFDSFADKFLITSVSIALLQNRIVCDFHVIPIYMIIARNLLMYFMRNYMNSAKKKNIESNMMGKCTTFIQMVSMFFLIGGLIKLGLAMLWASMICAVISFIGYFIHVLNSD